MLSKISQTEKDKCYISPICGIKKIIEMNVYKIERLTDIKKDLLLPKERGTGDGYEI